MAGSAETKLILSPLRHLDVDELRVAVRVESRARQRHLPPISVYRWWARRTESVTGAIIDAVGADLPGRLLLADPFAGGGVIALAALLRGHQIYAQDVNPWASRSLATMLSLPAPDEIDAASDRLHAAVADTLATAYATTMSDGTPGTIAQTLRVATGGCPGCDATVRLFPTATVSMLERVDCGGDAGYVACLAGHLHAASTTKRSSCATCGRYVYPRAQYTADRSARCLSCGWTGKIEEITRANGLKWEVVLVERDGSGCREIGPPTPEELAAAADERWTPQLELPVIGDGIETAVPRKLGMRRWHDLYPDRQRVVIAELLSACPVAAGGDEDLERALQAAVIGATEMAGYLSRWDARYLKSYETVANHRFNFTTLTAEPNVWGTEAGRGTVIRRLEQLAKASLWLEEHIGRPLAVDGPLPVTRLRTKVAGHVDARVVTGGSQRLVANTGALDAVITDPPYHDDVHYGELSDLFRAWAGELTGPLSGDATAQRKSDPAGTATYQKSLTAIFREIRRALRNDGHLILSYSNRYPEAWVALLSALQDGGFRAVGYTVVNSENEVDHAKAGRRACTLDVLIDLVPDSDVPMRRFHPTKKPVTDEDQFCRVVGRYALDIGQLAGDWTRSLTEELRKSKFLSPLPKKR